MNVDIDGLSLLMFLVAGPMDATWAHQTDTKGNLGRYILVSFFLVGTPFSLKKGALAPFLR
jgi:hypothetical protein